MAEERGGEWPERGNNYSFAAMKNWRMEVDENLKRLHSLLFGVDLALERGDHSAARTLALRLVGFLDSRTETPVDAALIAPIRAEASSKLAVASRALALESDRFVSFSLSIFAKRCWFWPVLFLHSSLI